MKKICVITGSRAEYSLLCPLMKSIQAHKDLELQVVATGTHLTSEYGYTYKKILNDGFPLSGKVDMLLSSDSKVAISKSLGLGVLGFADLFERIKPDILLFLGDRFEVFAAAQAGMMALLPMAHIHGGEITEAAIDDAMRHAMTKMSHLHFVSTEIYKKRVIQLGEDPSRVFNVGSLGNENIKNFHLLDKKTFEEQNFYTFSSLNFVVTYHPETLNEETSLKVILNVLKALDNFPKAHIIFTMANADSGGKDINREIIRYVSQNQSRAYFYKDLGSLNYLSAIQHCDVVIGNSSSGIIEVPSFYKPTINIGNRQTGRVKASSILDCGYETYDIVNAIKKALSPEFQKKLHNLDLPYGKGEAVSKKITDILACCSSKELLNKKFYDVKN
jgi:UDP-N-acetylglucosamine 2-epimerase (non-hydrolysing)/GDP/UDP-N,N'-diacetylbacillosamine 2-epimerase (hydrolysing)